MLFYLIGVMTIIWSIFNYKYGFMLYLSYKIILVTNITLISVPGVPLLTLDMFMSLCFLFIFFLKGKKVRFAKTSFPFMTPCLILCLSWSLSTLFSKAGFASEVSTLIRYFIDEFLILVLIWEVMETEDDFSFFMKVFTVVILISCVYGLFEYSIQSNPVQLYEATLNHDSNKVIDFNYGIRVGRGYHTQSLFEHAIGAGMCWALFTTWVFSSILDKGKKVNILQIITAVICVPMIILTKQRAGIVFLILLCPVFLKPRKKKTFLLIVLVLASGIVFFDEISDNLQIFTSIFNRNAQQIVGGSSAGLRFEQLSSALNLMLGSPIYGLGFKFSNVIKNNDIANLRGMESVWFMVLPSFGLIGIYAYLKNIWYGVYRIPKYFKSSNLFWIMIAYWIVFTLTSIPGFKTYLIYLFFTYMIKSTNKYKSLDINRVNEWCLSGNILKFKRLF